MSKFQIGQKVIVNIKNPEAEIVSIDADYSLAMVKFSDGQTQIFRASKLFPCLKKNHSEKNFLTKPLDIRGVFFGICFILLVVLTSTVIIPQIYNEFILSMTEQSTPTYQARPSYPPANNSEKQGNVVLKDPSRYYSNGQPRYYTYSQDSTHYSNGQPMYSKDASHFPLPPSQGNPLDDFPLPPSP